MTEIDRLRWNPLVDPALHIWGWEVSTYLFLGGLAAGIMMVSALLGTRVSAINRSTAARYLPFAAPVLLSLGMLALLLDLEYKLHVYRFFAVFRWSSPMSWGSWILLAVFPASLLLGAKALTTAQVDAIAGWPVLRRVRFGTLLRWGHALARQRYTGLRWLNLCLGAALGLYTGILLGTLGARPAWNTAMLGPLFLTSGFSSGAAFMALFPLTHAERETLRSWDIAALGLELGLLTLLFLALVTGSAASQAAARLVLGGRYTAVFWSLVVIAGLALPLGLSALEQRWRLRASVVSPLLVLTGGFALRWILVAAGQA